MGILINTGFDVGSSSPIDSRTVKNTTDERDALISDGLVYENLKVYCKDTQKEYRWTGTEWEEVGTGGAVDLSGYAKTYTSLTELELTAPVSVGEIFNAMPNKTMAVLACEDIADHITDVPMSYGVLTIKKSGVGRFSIDYQNSLFGSPCDVKRWIGTLKGSDVTELYWKQLSAEPTFVTLSDIGLTADATIQDVVDALPKGGSALLGVKNFTNYQTIFPYEEGNDQFARVHIVKGTEDGSIVYARWFRKDGVKEAIAKFNISDNKFSGWQKIQIGNTKATLVTNTTTLKLDITKKNNSWYGAIKLTYLYDTSPAEIEISFRSATDDLRWAVINGQKYVKNITFTQDSSNTAHYTIGIEFSGTTYGCYQAEVIGDFADINSLTSEAFTGAKTAVYYSPWGKNNGVSLVSAPEDIGLTFPCTSVQLVQAMRDKFKKTIYAGAIGIFNCEVKATTITDAPSDFGLLHIETFGSDRVLIRFDGISGANYAGSWIGQIKSTNGTFSSITWSRNNNNYSTTEQAVGTWVDGSTVYRKVFIINSVAAQTTEAEVEICNLGFNTQKRIINLSGTINSIGNEGVLPYAYLPNSFQFFSYLKDDSVYFKGTWKYPLNTVRIILEYIKN